MVARYADTQNIDEPLAMLRSGATSYYHADGLGSVTSLSNSAGSLAQTYAYDSFGKQTSSSGSLTMDVIHAGSKSFSFFNTSISREPRELFCGTLFCHIDKVIASRMQTTTFLKKVSRR